MNISVGQKIYNLALDLYPINRSLTGKGVLKSLEIISNYIADYSGAKLYIHNVPTGYKAFDWDVPKEWDIEEAYIDDEYGNRIIDFKDNNLHVLGYSTSVDKWVSLEELKQYIYTDENQKDAIPYVTSYYKERYGFSMTYNQLQSLKDCKYRMVIKSKLFNGNLSYGEVVIKPTEMEDNIDRGGVNGFYKNEILFSTYICHPSMANNECSGPALISELINYVQSIKNRRYTYRFLFIPETIGSIVYLSKNINHLKNNLKAGFVVSCVGDDKCYSMITSRYGNSFSDKVLKNILDFHCDYKTYSFLDRGSDERQYNAPNVDLGVTTFCRSKFGEYEEYHTSKDNMDFVSPAGFEGSFDVLTQVVDAIEYNKKYEINVLCEPNLGKRGLYPTISQKGNYDNVKSMMNFIAYADGNNDLIDISNIIGVPVKDLITVVNKLLDNNLLTNK